MVVITLLYISGYCQQGEWTWMNGDSAANSLGHFGTQGVFDSLNSPQGLYEACEWTDKDGNFWLFGGADSYHNVNSDLWKFNPVLNQWAWFKGSGMVNQAGIYGTYMVASILNIPGSRGFGSATWVDTSGDLWLFGGVGCDINGTNSKLNDLWKYHITTNEWTWMAGANTVNDPGNYGLIMVPNQLNRPHARSETNATWTDNSNNLWLFGGLTSGNLSDMWKYDLSLQEWVWMSGPNTPDHSTNYGTMGVPDTANIPMSRLCYSKLKDDNDNFWFFGGYNNPGNSLNDLWRFNPLTREWTWMKGDSIPNNLGISGTQCLSSIGNVPCARMESRSCWTRCSNNFVIFGGELVNGTNLFNDLWNYNVSTNMWTWLSGSVVSNQAANYGTILVANPSNIPSSRYGSIGWSDLNGNLWLFGGVGFAGYFNDMWKFVINPNCPLNSNLVHSSFTVDTLSGCKPLQIHLTNTSTNATSYFWRFSEGGTSTLFNPVHSYSHSGTYTITLVAYDSTACGVFSDTSVQTFYYTVFDPPTLPIITQHGDTLIITNFTTGLQWFRDTALISGATNQSYITSTNGCYYAEETDSNGCKSKSDSICFTTGIYEIIAHNGIIIYPNPSTTTVTIHQATTSLHPALLTITDVFGRELYKETLTSIDTKIDVSKWSGGVYFYEIGGKRGKIIIEHH